MMIPDEILVQSFCDGNDLAFVNLYNRYKSPIYIFCLKMLGDSDGAEDVVQNLFFKVYERKEQLRQPEKFKYWLFTIARNDCLTHIRKANNTTRFENDEKIKYSFSLTPEYDKMEDAHLLTQAIDHLSPEYKEIILLRMYNELSYKEIAEIVGVTESVVKSRLFTAREKLFKILKPIYGGRK